MFAQLNSIEAGVRNVPLEQVEKEFSDFIERATAIHDGMSLRYRMWRQQGKSPSLPGQTLCFRKTNPTAMSQE